MIRVVSNPVTFRRQCRSCTAVIEYDGSDVKHHQRGSSRCGPVIVRGVECPICTGLVLHDDPPASLDNS